MSQGNGKELESFEVKSLDLGGLTDADVSSPNDQRVRFLIEPGSYNLNIIDHKLYMGKKDAAGKQWGSVLLTVQEPSSGRILKDFVSVPVESLVYTAKSGNTSKIKTQIFVNLIGAITGKKPALSEVAEYVANLSNILTGASIRASLGYKNDTVRFVGENEEGEALFGIVLANGTQMLGDNGESLTFTSRDAASAFYQQKKGFAPARGMNIISFYPAASKQSVA